MPLRVARRRDRVRRDDGAGVVAAAGAWYAAPLLGPIKNGTDIVGAARAVLAVWVLVLFWLAGRVLVVPRFARGSETSYADGTRVLADADCASSRRRTKSCALGARTKPLRSRDGELARTIDADGTLTYATPVATATYRADGTAAVDGTPLRARDARVWWIVLARERGAARRLEVERAVRHRRRVGDRRGRRRAALAAPARRFSATRSARRVDVVAAAIVVVGGIVYMASYIPYFALGHGFVDVVGMQQQMYDYHAHLVATHPYASQWWQWPLLDKPILYYAHYTHVRRRTANAARRRSARCRTRSCGGPGS